MSDTIDTVGRNRTNGQFIKGYKGGGRPKGARSKLAEAFVEDMRDAWNEFGVDVIKRVARDDPSTFLKTFASLMPRDVNLTLGVDAASFAATFKNAVSLLGNDAPAIQVRRALPNAPKVIDHD